MLGTNKPHLGVFELCRVNLTPALNVRLSFDHNNIEFGFKAVALARGW